MSCSHVGSSPVSNRHPTNQQSEGARLLHNVGYLDELIGIAKIIQREGDTSASISGTAPTLKGVAYVNAACAGCAVESSELKLSKTAGAGPLPRLRRLWHCALLRWLVRAASETSMRKRHLRAPMGILERCAQAFEMPYRGN